MKPRAEPMRAEEVDAPRQQTPKSVAGVQTGVKRRPYRKAKRAASELQTRERIVEATVALHESLGPARTTVKAIAERAGVQRATVYRHFPDMKSLFDSCNDHYYRRHPMPDPRAWAAVRPPAERLRAALADLYGWYAETEQMLSAGVRDLESVPAATREAFLGYFHTVRKALMAGRPERGRARARISGAIGHAITFVTWQSLVREQALSGEEAVALMTAMIDAAAGGSPHDSS